MTLAAAPTIKNMPVLRVELLRGSPDRVWLGEHLAGDGWGVETADRGSFISVTEHGWNNNQVWRKAEETPFSSHGQVDASLSESRHLIDLATAVDGNVIHRQIDLETLQPSVFQDFVCRFRFDAKLFPVGEIAGRQLQHRSSNIWHQFPVDRARVSGPLGSFEVRATQWQDAGLFRLDAYLRDEPSGLWILHLRMMPVRDDLFWIRWHTRLGTLVKLTDAPAKMLLRFGPLRRALWYLAERRGGRPNLQAQPLAVAPTGTRLMIRSETRFIPVGPS